MQSVEWRVKKWKVWNWVFLFVGWFLLKKDNKMKKIKSKNFKTASIVFVILWIIYISIRYLAKSIIGVNKICYDDTCFIVELAQTKEERQTGLMYRENMPKNRWMFFVFEENKLHPFWMKNTLIPLDIIWIDSIWVVVDIQTVPPCQILTCPIYNPKWVAKYVLEINAWLAEDKGIQIWEKLDFKIKGLRK